MLKRTNVKMKIKINLILVILVAILCIGTYSIATYEPEIKVRDLGTRNISSVRFGSNEGRNITIPYEKLATDLSLYCRQHGVFLPSLKSASRPDRDGTIEVQGVERTIREYNESSRVLGKTRGDAYSVSPYGPEGSTYADVYVAGQFKVDRTVESRPADAFINAMARYYEKSTENYPNPVQSARWAILKSPQGGVSDRLDFSDSGANASSEARDLAKAALLLEQTMKKQEDFKEEHLGHEFVDLTNYENLKTAYNKDKQTVLVGPFTVDYVWKMYKPKTAMRGNVTNENGDLELSVLEQLKFYSDDAMRREIANFDFKYPNRDKSNQNAVKVEEQLISYKYPLPKEEFYIEFSDQEYKDVKAVNQMYGVVRGMKAQGRHEEMSGTSQHIRYLSKVENIPCDCSVPIGNTNKCARHPESSIGDGHLIRREYWVEGTLMNGVVVQPTMHIVEATIPVTRTGVAIPLGTPQTSTWLPMIFPVPLYGKARTSEKVITPVLPVNPEPNKPEPTYEIIKPDPENIGFPAPTPDNPTPTPTPDNPTPDNPTPTPDNPTPRPTPDTPTPETPNEPVNPEVRLTFDIAGIVWEDELLGKGLLANGTKDPNEKGMSNVIVRLYKDGDPTPVRETLTNENGEYLFQYVRVGYDYYVEFTYDGMTYTTTKYMGTQSTALGVGDTSAVNEAYKANPKAYTNVSHAVEDYAERLAFNSKFAEISNGQAVGSAGVIPLTYRRYVAEGVGSVSALITTDDNYVVAEPFKMKASTKTAGLMYLLDRNYVASTEDLNLTQLGPEYYYHATYPATLNINLGLIQREKADFAVKNDVYQAIVTKDENLQTYISNSKTTNALTYDAHTRIPSYYTGKVFTQRIDKADYNVKYDAPEYKGTQDLSKELNVYIEYKFLIRNQSALQVGSVLELTNHFDSNLEYATSYDFTNLTSWIETNMIDENKEVYREPITWNVVSNENGYTTIKTTGIGGKFLISGETLELHLILKVKKDANRNVIMDLGDGDFKENVLEISKYTFSEGMIDRDSNPGNVHLEQYDTYEDDTDIAPFVKLVYSGDPDNQDEPEESRQGKVISGYVWEDFVNQVMPNNLYTGNGIKDENEKNVKNVKVELIQVLKDNKTGEELQILRGETRTDDSGKYQFTNLASGMYKVKFTYGDETQLREDKTYNGQDYKSVTTDTLKQYFVDPSMEVMILADTSEGMIKDGVNQMIGDSAKALINSLYERVQKVKIGATLFSEPNNGGDKSVGLTTKPGKGSVLSVFDDITANTGTSLEDAINSSLAKYSADAAGKVMIICTDGYISSDARDALNEAASRGVKVISIVDSTDVWTELTFGTEYTPTTGKLYYVRNVNIPQYLREVALEDAVNYLTDVLPNLLQAKDVQKSYSVSEKSEIGAVYTRQRNMDYTDTLVYENGSIVNGEKTTNLSEFANNTQVTAITPIRNVMLKHDNAITSDANLGLIERPRAELQIREEIAGIQVKLANDEVIIDTDKDLTKNVQVLPGSKENIYMDKEIMQGATLDIKYRITVFNNGHVDTLGEYYYDYDMYNTPIAEKYNSAVATNVGTIYSYYTNLTFRPEDNSNMEIEKNAVVTDAEINKDNVDRNIASFTNWKSYIKENGTRKDGMKNDGVQTPEVKDVVVLSSADGKTQVMSEKAKWETQLLVKTGVGSDERLVNGSVKTVQTSSLNNIALYPVMSKEVIKGNGVSSVSTYLTFSKSLASNDETDTMTYKQSVEIVEKLNELGRRDYEAVPGNYVPHSEIKEYDSAKVEDVYVLPPFGENMQTYFALAIGATVLLGAGVVFIRRRIVK